MHTVLGVGKQRIIYLNTKRSKDVDALFDRVANLYRMKFDMGYPDICMMHSKSSMVFSDDTNVIKKNDVCVSFDERPMGIYVGDHAYHKRIAQRVCQISGIELVAKESTQHINIGIGGLGSLAEAYMVLKDVMLGLPTLL